MHAQMQSWLSLLIAGASAELKAMSNAASTALCSHPAKRVYMKMYRCKLQAKYVQRSADWWATVLNSYAYQVMSARW